MVAGEEVTACLEREERLTRTLLARLDKWLVQVREGGEGLTTVLCSRLQDYLEIAGPKVGPLHISLMTWWSRGAREAGAGAGECGGGGHGHQLGRDLQVRCGGGGEKEGQAAAGEETSGGQGEEGGGREEGGSTEGDQVMCKSFNNVPNSICAQETSCHA